MHAVILKVLDVFKNLSTVKESCFDISEMKRLINSKSINFNYQRYDNRINIVLNILNIRRGIREVASYNLE